MSTTIYNGLLVNSSLADLHKELVRLKPDIQSLASRIVTSAIVHDAIDLFDQANASILSDGDKRLADGQTFDALIARSYGRICDRFRNIGRSGHRDPAIDTSFDISLHPSGNRTVLISFCEQQEMKDLLEQAIDAKDISYQDQSDRPKGVMTIEWRKRRKLWESILPTGRPADTFLSFEICHGQPALLYDADLVGGLIPSDEERIEALARHAHLASIDFGPDRDIHDLINLAMEYSSNEDIKSEWRDNVRPTIATIALGDS